MEVALRPITADTVRRVTDLRVAPEQQRFVASNAESLAQALFTPQAWYRAIEADGSLAGFVMLYDESLGPCPPARPAVALWRFMIDRQHKRQGRSPQAIFFHIVFPPLIEIGFLLVVCRHAELQFSMLGR